MAFSAKEAATWEGGVTALRINDFVSHTELCLQLKTGFLTLKDVTLTALLKPMVRDVGPECLASSGAWCFTPSVQVELALLC